MTSLSRLKPFYVSLSVRNNQINAATFDFNSADDIILANVNTNFRQPIMEKASDYLCAVERMELNLNGVPFYDGSNFTSLTYVQNQETLIIRSRITPSMTWPYILSQSAYSLSHLFEILNSINYQDPNDNTIFNLTWSLNKDGFTVVSIVGGKTFTRFQIEIPRRLNEILGISTDRQINGRTSVDSAFPRIDCGDDLDHVILITNLPTNSDSLGNVKNQVLTDFSSPSQYSNSLAYGADGTLIRSGFTTNIRQKIIYNPNERRYLELLGDFPITNIQVQAMYVNQDGTQKNVPLPLGASFELKLGFYLKQ